MAKNEDPFRNTFQTSATAQKEARERLREGIDQRSKSKILLSPDEAGGDYDMARALVTSMGKQGLRPITYDDLKVFQANVRLLGKRFKGGITAKQVIDLSMPGPRERAQKQIHTAMPITYRGGRVMFQTNAGPDSKHKYHTVTVELMNYEACVASPIDPRKVVSELLKGKIKLDCGCEFWRYTLRYIATTGRYAAGPWFENSFPKQTNPMLLGVGCKHVLRVMQVISSSSTFKNYAVRMIEQGRTSVERTTRNTKLKEMQEFAKKHKSEDSRKRQIKTSADKKVQRQAQPSYQRQQAARKAHAELNKQAKAKPAATKVVNETKQVAMMMESFGWTREQAMAAISASKATK